MNLVENPSGQVAAGGAKHDASNDAFHESEHVASEAVPGIQDVDATFASAAALHAQGQLSEAAELYKAVIAARDDHAEALHMYGVLCYQRGEIAEAEQLIRRSTRIDPQPLALANLGLIVAQDGRRDEAIEHYEAALRLEPGHLHALVRLGIALIELRRYENAVSVFDRALAASPLSIDALANRGVALRALGRFDDAREMYERALTVNSRSFESHANLGNVLLDLGRHADALVAYDRALALQPSLPEVLAARGRTLIELDRPQEALASFNEAIASKPDFVEAIYNSAVALERLGRLQEALQRCTRVLALEPSHPRVHSARGNANLRLERYEDALADYAVALKVEPNSPDVLCNCGSALRKLERFAEAVERYDAALALQPTMREAWCNRANVQQDMDRHEDAIESFDKALAIDPRYVQAWLNRGNSLLHLGRYRDAFASYDHALEVAPDAQDVNFAKAFLHLHQGEFEQGWAGYEWRLRDEKSQREARDFVQPRWTGNESLDGKTILIHSEQGFGDTLQFCRYVDKLHGLGARVVFEVQAPLKTLLSLRRDPATVIARGEALPDFDFHCELLSLPFAFRTDWHNIPNVTPYIEADIERVNAWNHRLGPKTRKRIGIAWSGNPHHVNDRRRSIELSTLLPIFDRNVQWVSLQKAVRARDWATLEQTPLLDVEAHLNDFADTAALIESLDLVISVDSAVAHLAGALNRPVWLLLTDPAEWRWLDDRSDSPWYPTARLFRQSAPGQWQDVVNAVRDAIDTELLAHSEGVSTRSGN
ncbi:Glycosyltransferase 9 family protein [Pararobbsia alpina]|uniref:tetratricopeptide repeat protein n=1 Tax=Pararobbsia alpina TaxID=621374 RepID=UPI0039A74F49